MALGDVIVVPVVNPVSACELSGLAAVLAAADGGRVIPLTVVSPDASEHQLRTAHGVVDAAARQARQVGADSAGVVLRDPSVVDGVLRCMAEQHATLTLMGWQGASTQRNVFGELIDSIVGRSRMPLAVVRSRPDAYRRIVLPISGDHLLPGGARGLRLAVDVATRVRMQESVTVLRTGDGTEPLPAEVQALGDRVHHDRRRADQAVAAIAGPGDLIVVPVAATASGLRSATTHMAWAAPDSWLLVTIDVGPALPGGAIAEAVAQAGSTPVTPLEEDITSDYAIEVSARPHAPSTELDVSALEATLRLVGAVETRPPAPQEHGMHRLTVTVSAPSANVAVGAVLGAVHACDRLQGVEVTYDVAT